MRDGFLRQGNVSRDNFSPSADASLMALPLDSLAPRRAIRLLVDAPPVSFHLSQPSITRQIQPCQCSSNLNEYFVANFVLAA